MKAGWNLWAICWALGTLVAGCTAEKTLRMQNGAPAAFEHQAAGHEAAWPGKEWYRGFSSDQLNSGPCINEGPTSRLLYVESSLLALSFVRTNILLQKLRLLSKRNCCST